MEEPVGLEIERSWGVSYFYFSDYFIQEDKIHIQEVERLFKFVFEPYNIEYFIFFDELVCLNKLTGLIYVDCCSNHVSYSKWISFFYLIIFNFLGNSL